MSWIFFAVFTSLGYSCFGIFMKLVSGKISSSVAAMIVSAAAFMVAAIFSIFLKASGQNLICNKNLVIFPILAGILACLSDIAYFLMLDKGISVSIASPFVLGGTVFFTVILGILFLKEELNLINSLGIIMIVIGSILLIESN